MPYWLFFETYDYACIEYFFSDDSLLVGFVVMFHAYLGILGSSLF